MKTTSIILCLCLFFFTLSCKQQEGEIKLVSQEEMQTLLQLDGIQLVDVRTPEEYKSGYIAEAQNIDFWSPTFEEDVKTLDKERPVILYCKSGGRSAKCAEKMKNAGFKKIYDLDGGISKWKHDGLKVTVK